VNAKIHGGFYLVPLFLLYWKRRGVKQALAVAVATVFLTCLPYLLPSISITLYGRWLLLASKHGLGPKIFVHNLSYAILFLIPLLCLIVAYGRDGVIAGEEKPSLWGFAVSLIVVLVLGSKKGAGPWHLLPFGPVISIYMALWLSRADENTVATIYAARRRRQLMFCAFSSWIGVMTIVSYANQKDFFSVCSARNGEPAEARRELVSIMREFPEYDMIMGYGEGASYRHTFFRPLLFTRGRHNVLDQAALADMPADNKIPTSTVNAFMDQAYDIVVIPAGGKPFYLGNVFNNAFRQAFHANYSVVRTRKFFDVWMANRLLENTLPNNSVTEPTNVLQGSGREIP
jgi:hypothetical protein